VADLFQSEDGIAARIEDYVNEYVKTGGFLDDTATSIESRISRIDRQIAQQEDLMARKEAHYRQQFTSLQESLLMLSGQSSSISTLNQSIFAGYGGLY
jgi:flagellar capping protein FliD